MSSSLRAKLVLAQRSTMMVWTMVPHILSFVRDQRRFLLFGGPRAISPDQHKKRAERIKHDIERMGTAYIKLGQLVSTRADLIPQVYVDEIAKLQDGIKPLPGKEARRALEEIYGKKLEEVFDRFDENAVGAASLAQVHYAVWQGRDVAVKFVRPDIPDQMAADLKIAGLVIRILNEKFDNSLTNMLATAISEGAKGMAVELDLTNEQKNLEMMGKLLEKRNDVTVPQLYPEASHAKAIVMEYCPGLKVTESERLRACGFDFRDVIERMVTLYSEMIFVQGIYHADPHPGNILIGDGAQIILLDYGMVCRLSKETRDVVLDSVVAGLRGDREKLVDGLYASRIVNPDTDRSKIHAFVEEIVQLHRQNLGTRSRLEQVGLLIERTARELRLNLPGELVYVFRSLTLLEGMATKMIPGWNLLEHGIEPMKTALASQYVQNQIETQGMLNMALDEFRRFIGHRTVRRFT